MISKINLKPGADAQIVHKGIDEPSRIFCDRVEYLHDKGKFEGQPIFDHHLMFWLGNELVFKVYLPNGAKSRDFEDVYDALKSVGIKIM